MKKIVLVLLLLTLCLSLFACTNDDDTSPGRAAPDADENPADGNTIDLSQIYLFERGADGTQKFNVLTGESSPLCPDPLCEEHHRRSACVFGGASMVQASGEWLYFLSYKLSTPSSVHDVLTHTGSICAYNFVTREFKVLYSVSDSVFENASFQSLFHYRDGYLYTRQRAYNSETEDYDLWSLIRVNADTGGAEVIVSASPAEYVIGIGDVLIFEDRLSVRGETTIYKTDMSYQNRVDLMTVEGLAGVYHYFSYGNYIYVNHYVAQESGPRRPALIRIEVQTGETEQVTVFPSDIIIPAMIDDWIYYVQHSDRDKGVIHRVSATGGDPEIYYEIPDFRIVFIEKVGKYIVAISQHDGERDHRVIDTETGELVVY
jgi:hypothetical protein